MPAPIDITGQRFGRLIAAQKLESDKHGKVQWRFTCDCGSEKVATGSEVKSGKVSSCGCLLAETRADNGRRGGPAVSASKIKHGHAVTKSPEYAIWKTMRQRCLNPSCADYPDYGARGITVCSRWSDFASFYEDMGPRPSRRHSLDRADNDGPYEPDNCRWATAIEQANNRRPRRAA